MNTSQKMLRSFLISTYFLAVSSQSQLVQKSYPIGDLSFLQPQDSYGSPVEIITLPSHLWMMEDAERESITNQETTGWTTTATEIFEVSDSVPAAVPETATDTEQDSLSTDACHCEESNQSPWIWLLVTAILFSLAIGFLFGYLLTTKLCAKKGKLRVNVGKGCKMRSSFSKQKSDPESSKDKVSIKTKAEMPASCTSNVTLTLDDEEEPTYAEVKKQQSEPSTCHGSANI